MEEDLTGRENLDNDAAIEHDTILMAMQARIDAQRARIAICDCEGPHYVGAQISCRGLDGVGATGIFAK